MVKQHLDADMISLESMIAAKDSAQYALRTMLATEEASNWAFWMLVMTSLGLVFSIVTLYCAFRALSTWREQEQLKVKVEFKKSLIKMHDLLVEMPEKNLTFYSNIGRNIKASTFNSNIEPNVKELKSFYQKKALEEEFAKAEHNWAISEELFIGSKTHVDWSEFKKLIFSYTKLNTSKGGLCELLDTMKSELVIFRPRKGFLSVSKKWLKKDNAGCGW
jgi:hypothetical protein